MTSDLERLCARLKIRAVSTYLSKLPMDAQDWPRDAHHYRVVLRLEGRQLTTTFHQGSAHTQEPTAADVLYCLCSDARAGELDFEDFCSEFGYDTDSRKAEKIWKACTDTAPKVRQLLGPWYEAVSNAEH